MEKNYKKIIIGLIILVVTLLAALGYFIYESYRKSESKGFRVVVSSINNYVNEFVDLKDYIYTDGIELNDVTFVVKDPSIASITNGEVTFLKKGTTTIEANYKKIKETIIVNVSELEDVNEDTTENDTSVIIDDSKNKTDNVYKKDYVPTTLEDGNIQYKYGEELKVILGTEIEATLSNDVERGNYYSILKLKINGSEELKIDKIMGLMNFSIFRHYDLYIFIYAQSGHQCRTQEIYIFDKNGTRLSLIDNPDLDGVFKFTFLDNGIIGSEEYRCPLYYLGCEGINTIEDAKNTALYSKIQKYKYDGKSLNLFYEADKTVGQQCLGFVD